jgi:hypothetical protein
MPYYVIATIEGEPEPWLVGGETIRVQDGMFLRFPTMMEAAHFVDQGRANLIGEFADDPHFESAMAAFEQQQQQQQAAVVPPPAPPPPPTPIVERAATSFDAAQAGRPRGAKRHQRV